MCQLCAIKPLVSNDRWPKPLEHYKADIDLLVTSAHDEYTTYHQTPHEIKLTTNLLPPAQTPIPKGLLDLLRLLDTLLEDLESERQKWWTSPEKRAQRRRLEEECEQKKLTELHKINNAMLERVEGMTAKLGRFVRWGLAMNGGVWELRNGGKVKAEEDKGGTERNEEGSVEAMEE